MSVARTKIYLAAAWCGSTFCLLNCMATPSRPSASATSLPQTSPSPSSPSPSANQNTPSSTPATPTTLRSVNSGKVLGVLDGNNADGTAIQQNDASAAANQQWVFDAQPDGSVAIRNSLTNKVMDITGGNQADGTNVLLWTFLGTPDQFWLPRAQSANVYMFANVDTGKCLDLLGQRTDDGAPVGQWDCNGEANQQWVLDGTPPPASQVTSINQAFSLLSIWDDLTNSALDENTIQAQMQKMQQQVGQNRDYFKVGFAHVYGGHTALLRNARLSQANNLSLGVILAYQTHDVDSNVANMAIADHRNYQWRLDGVTWQGEVVQSNGSQEFPARDWQVVTPSRYATSLHNLYISEVSTAAADIAAVMKQYPGTIAAVNAVIEEEMATGGEDSDNYLADYSPFAIAEFRDWLRHKGIYDDTSGKHAGEGAREVTVGFIKINGVTTSQFYDDPSPSDSGGTGQTFNSYFGTNFSTWKLAYWDLDSFPGAITDDNFSPTPGSGNGATSGGFDAPRSRDANNKFWSAWSYDVADHGGNEPVGNPAAPAFGFRQFMLKHFVGDMLDAIAAQGVPKNMIYAHQIPGEQIDAPRALSGADPLWTALWDNGGTLGSTRFGGYDSASADSYSHNWGIFEWHPAPGSAAQDPALYQATTAALNDFYSHHGTTFFPGWWFNGPADSTFPLNDSQMAQAMHDWLASKLDAPR